MHSIRTVIRAAVFSLAALATPALAEEAFVRAPTAVRAGPDIDYPAINALRPGDLAFVHGCLVEFDWCDVTARRTRGWVLAANLEILEGARRVLVPAYGPRLGLPIVSFSVGNYWDRHYRDRPWFHDRDRFARSPDWNERRRFDRDYEVERPREFRGRVERPSIQRPEPQRIPEFKQPGFAVGGPPAAGPPGPPPGWRGKAAPGPVASPPPPRGGGQGGGGGPVACPPGVGKCS